MIKLPWHALVFAVTAALPWQASAAAEAFMSCASIADDVQRLQCYDRVAQERQNDAVREPPREMKAATAAQPRAATWLEQQWELRPELTHGTFALTPYRPLYLLIHGMRSPNDRPSSPTRQLDPGTDVDLKSVEAKFQLSFKTKLVQNLAGTDGDLWFGYTQQSFWQIGNTHHSSPFRESDYEPELMYIHPLTFELAGFTGRYFGLTVNHQSNGRDKPLSRSWNRLIGELAAESGAWSVHVRPWARLFAPGGDRDDNPDIQNYVGRGELIVAYRANRQVISFAGRHSLRTGDASRGSAKLDWAFPLVGSLNGHVQLFSGYGESLIDYNHRQTSLGIGVSFND